MKKRFNKVYIEISNVCNLACSFCPKTDRAPRFMSLAELARVLDALTGYTDYVYFHLMGEPLLHPELAPMLALAGEKCFHVIITTNGTLLEKAGGLLTDAPAVHKVNISLQSFEANSRSEDVDGYIDTCAAFAKRCAAAGKLCVLRLWNKNGLESLNPRIEARLRDHFPDEWSPSRQSLRLADRVYLEFGEKFDWPDLTADEGGAGRFCYGLRDQLGILCDGTVVPCCLDHNGDLALGNLFETPLSAILAGQRAKAIFNGFSNRKAVEELCRKCGYVGRFG